MRLTKLFRLISVSALLFVLPVSAFAWRFVSIADSRSGKPGVNTEVLSRIVSRINLEKADLVIFQGDMANVANDEQLLPQLDVWKSVMSKLKCPYYLSVGNHEIFGTPSEDIIREKFDMPTNGPKDCKELVYSFDYNNAHFVCVDSERWGELRHKVQSAWVRADLAKNTKPHVFVFSHDPAFPKGPHIGSSLDQYPVERDAFWRLIGSHSCRMYFCGHEHLYARDEKDGVTQVINGTCGAPAHKVAGTSSKYNYVVVDVDGPKVSCVAKDDNGTVIDRWGYSLEPTRSRP